MAPRDKDLQVDLENGGAVTVREEEEEDYNTTVVSGVKKKAQLLLAKVKGCVGVWSDGRASLSGSPYVENLRVVTSMNVMVQNSKDYQDNETELVKEKRKNLSNKKPPRPPRAPSLDAADQKLIREIAELARLKRARIERIKTSKKMRASKATSSNSNMSAMVVTIIFFLIFIFQGISSKGTAASFQGSPLSAEGGVISVQFVGNPSASIPTPDYGSPNLVEQVAGSDGEAKLRRIPG